MSSYLCHFGNYGSLGNWGVLNWIGLILTMAFWFAMIAGLALLVFWALRRSRVPAAKVPYATGKPSTNEILQVQYARGEINREQYEARKLDLETGKDA